MRLARTQRLTGIGRHNCGAKLLIDITSRTVIGPRIEARPDLWQRLEPQLVKEADAGNRIGTILATAASIGGLLLGLQLGRAATSDLAPATAIPRTELVSVSPAEYFVDLPVNTFAANILELTALLPRPRTGETNP